MISHSKPKKQLFFLHFAGGNAFSYNFLLNLLNPAYEVHQLELPGRGKRMGEAFASDRAAASADYLDQITRRQNGRPFLIYGHSMGASLSLLVTSALEQKGLAPETLIVSGNSGPGLDGQKMRHLMENEAFIRELKSIGGMPDEFFEHQELVDLYIPILKSDFKICEEAAPVPPKVSTPIIALMGHEEENVGRIANWANYTSADFNYKIFKGNHFFIHEHKASIAKLINDCLS